MKSTVATFSLHATRVALLAWALLALAAPTQADTPSLWPAEDRTALQATADQAAAKIVQDRPDPPSMPDAATATDSPAKAGANPKSSEESAARANIDPEKLFSAIVKVSTRAVPNARSAGSLGQEREGTGVVIGNNLVLTIGYLIVEADDVKLTDGKGHTFPAQVIAYDHASGFGLVRSVVPLSATPVTLGDSTKVGEREPVLIASAADDGAAFAWVVSKRPFTGSWEYQLDSAIFTSPPALNWSGAALIDRNGRLLGIGSLIVREATEGEVKLPGNLFVPIDLLKPILADLIRDGHRGGPARPWLGISADEVQGRLLITRVSPESPADRAGLQEGDIILGFDGNTIRTQSEFYQKLWSTRHAGDDVPLKVLQGQEVRELMLHSIDRLEYFRPKTTI